MLSHPAFRQMSTTLPPSVPGNEIKQLSFPSTWPVYWLLSGEQPDLPPPTHTQTHLILVTEFLGGFKNNNEHGGNNQYPPWPRCWSSVGVNSGLFFYSSLSGWKNFSHWLMVAQWWRIRLQEMQVLTRLSSVQSLSRILLFATRWIAARQASLSITNSRSSLRLTSVESVMPSSHLILCRPLLLLPPILPSIRVEI